MTAATTPALAYGPATDIAVGENANPAAAGPHAPYATHPSTTKKETIPMTDQTIPTDEDRRIARDWAAHIIGTPVTSLPMEAAAARVILHDIPAPPRPTLADMTEEERGKRVGGQVDVSAEAFGGRAILTGFETATLMGMEFPRALILTRDCRTFSVPTDEVTPRPDLPRMTWPGEQKPAPALPEGWRLADHPKHGRVIVTNPTPDVGGHIYFVSPAPSPIGNDWHYCAPAELTYLDQEGDQ